MWNFLTFRFALLSFLWQLQMDFNRTSGLSMLSMKPGLETFVRPNPTHRYFVVKLWPSAHATAIYSANFLACPGGLGDFNAMLWLFLVERPCCLHDKIFWFTWIWPHGLGCRNIAGHLTERWGGVRQHHLSQKKWGRPADSVIQFISIWCHVALGFRKFRFAISYFVLRLHVSDLAFTLRSDVISWDPHYSTNVA